MVMGLRHKRVPWLTRNDNSLQLVVESHWLRWSTHLLHNDSVRRCFQRGVPPEIPRPASTIHPQRRSHWSRQLWISFFPLFAAQLLLARRSYRSSNGRLGVHCHRSCQGCAAGRHTEPILRCVEVRLLPIRLSVFSYPFVLNAWHFLFFAVYIILNYYLHHHNHYLLVRSEPNGQKKLACLAHQDCPFDANLTQKRFLALYDRAHATLREVSPTLTPHSPHTSSDHNTRLQKKKHTRTHTLTSYPILIITLASKINKNK